jgi:hypothetical protein
MEYHCASTGPRDVNTNGGRNCYISILHLLLAKQKKIPPFPLSALRASSRVNMWSEKCHNTSQEQCEKIYNK